MNTKDEKSIGLNILVAELFGAGEKAVTQYLKKKGLTDETIAKSKEAGKAIIKDMFEGIEEDEQNNR